VGFVQAVNLDSWPEKASTFAEVLKGADDLDVLEALPVELDQRSSESIQKALALLTLITGVRGRPAFAIRSDAIERRRENPCCGRFSDPWGAIEQDGARQSPGLDQAAKLSRHGLLRCSDQLIELSRAVLQRERGLDFEGFSHVQNSSDDSVNYLYWR
jgi:hypothetical protein